jgi:hypothetical protein
MSTTDYLVSALLVFSVVRQIRPRRITVLGLAWPIALVALFGMQYLHGIPTSESDLLFIAGGTALGLVLGTCCGAATIVRPAGDGAPVARATLLAGGLWVIGMAARAAFALYAENGGAATIGRWSAALHIHSAETWAAALILMSLAEVLSRTAVLGWRAYAVRTAGPLPVAVP